MDKRPVCVVQHAGCETLGLIEDAFRAENLGSEFVRTYNGEVVPQTMENYKALVVMGGPMGVYEQEKYPFLTREIRLLESALKEKKPVLGICLGSQLLAAALGAKVAPSGCREIGWHPITLTNSATEDRLWAGVPRSFHAFHWHGDTFELPLGAIPLAYSERTPHQAFRHGQNVYGFLFHMEITAEILQGMVSTFGDELTKAEVNPEHLLEPLKTHLANLHYIGTSVFQRWARLARTHAV